MSKDLREPHKVLAPHNIHFPVLGLGTNNLSIVVQISAILSVNVNLRCRDLAGRQRPNRWSSKVRCSHWIQAHWLCFHLWKRYCFCCILIFDIFWIISDDYEESEVGVALEEALKENNLKREDVFVTSKLWNDCHRVEHGKLIWYQIKLWSTSTVKEACQQTLSDLHLTYLDLYLIHFPISFVHGVKEATSSSHVLASIFWSLDFPVDSLHHPT